MENNFFILMLSGVLINDKPAAEIISKINTAREAVDIFAASYSGTEVELTYKIVTKEKLDNYYIIE